MPAGVVLARETQQVTLRAATGSIVGVLLAITAALAVGFWGLLTLFAG